MNKRLGGCACGAIRFVINAPVKDVGVCHCKDCQKASGGPPNYVALVPTHAFEVTQGEPAQYKSEAESGRQAIRVFCSNCGSPLWSVAPLMPFTPIKLGALDDSSDLRPGVHLYTASAASWHFRDEDLPSFEKMPPVA
ncbi:MAG: GFA family protein [Burkholderiaceae bacterium]